MICWCFSGAPSSLAVAHCAGFHGTPCRENCELSSAQKVVLLQQSNTYRPLSSSQSTASAASVTLCFMMAISAASFNTVPSFNVKQSGSSIVEMSKFIVSYETSSMKASSWFVCVPTGLPANRANQTYVAQHACLNGLAPNCRIG
jgi:hypothetical protein